MAFGLANEKLNLMTAKRFLLYSFILLIFGACAGTKKVTDAESPALSD